MGVIYSVVLLDQNCIEWLDSEGIAHPPIDAMPRYPTPREIAETLSSLPNLKATIDSDSQSNTWTAQVEAAGGLWTQIQVREFSSDEEPHEFYFSKGSPEVVFAIVGHLAKRCGPLVVVDDSSCHPIVVAPGADLKDLVRHYSAT